MDTTLNSTAASRKTTLCIQHYTRVSHLKFKIDQSKMNGRLWFVPVESRTHRLNPTATAWANLRREPGPGTVLQPRTKRTRTLFSRSKMSKAIYSVIIAAFAVGSCSIEFIMQFLYAGYEINSSEADQIKNATITGSPPFS
jgi:hypothetical protein